MEIVSKYFEDLTETQISQIQKLGSIYEEWNQKINVISRKDIELLYEKHVLHSLAIAVICPFDEGTKIIDIGTGGGFPGIPLAIFFPEAEFLLVDSIAKKIKVVDEVVKALELQNVTTLHGRVEEIRNKKFDYAVSRAVAPLADLWRWINPSLRIGQNSAELPNGLLCLKGGDLTKEISESGLKRIVQAWAVKSIFNEPAFEEKYLLYVPKLI